MPKYCNAYLDLLKAKPIETRTHIRNIALSILSKKYMIFDIDALLSLPRIQFLYFHHMFVDEGMGLEKLIARLAKVHNFISYENAVNLIVNGKVDKPYIVFSSDDGFKNNIHAAEILHHYGISCCFFINPGIVGINEHSAIVSHCQQKLNMPPVEFMNWNDIDYLQSLGHEIGAHTMFHDNVKSMSMQQFSDDLILSREILIKYTGKANHFSWPYGRKGDFSLEALKNATQSGYISCASAIRGCHIKTNNDRISLSELIIRRDHIIFAWQLEHIMYFLANNLSRSNTIKNNIYG